MHPALHSWRDEWPAYAVRLMAYVGGLTLLSMAAAEFYQSTPVKSAIVPADQSGWIAIEKPFPAFTLSIPEAAGQPETYAIQRHERGEGRKDILSLGSPHGATPYLEVTIYRAGREIARFAPPVETVVTEAAALGPVNITPVSEPLATKFGPLALARFETSQGAPRFCLGFVRAYDDPMLQIAGRFCQSDNFIQDSTLSCALDRLTLLYAGSEPKIGALFAQAELNRSYCGQRDPLMAATPKYRLLWKALEMGPPPARRADR
jgi:hypothetical protein